MTTSTLARSRNRRHAILVTAPLLLTLAGCTVGPNYSTPQVATPEAFANLDAAQPLGIRGDQPGTSLAAWWNDLGDATLASLIQRAVEGNRDLRIAVARVDEARALRGIAASGQFPRVDIGAGADRSRQSETTGIPGQGDRENASVRLGVDASWEIDVFGGVRREVQAADADLQSLEEQRHFVLISLAAEVARAYIDLRSNQHRTLVTDRSIAAQAESVDLTRSRLEAGLAAELEVAQAQAQLAVRRSQRPPLTAAGRAALHRLAVLLGQAPGSLNDELATTAAMPTAPTNVAVGLPSDLLRRRPDVRAAERRIAAATARVGVATADLFPRFSLTGSFGLSSSAGDRLFDMNSRTWSIGPTMRWNIFDAGAVRRSIDAANQRERQAFFAYEQTVLTSLEEVENALVQLSSEEDRRGALREAVRANQRAVELATERYRTGVGDFLNVLESQRQLYDAEDQLVQSETATLRSVIALYLALGGGWDAGQGPQTPEPPAGTPTPAQ